MFHFLADNYSKNNGWSWQGALFGLALLAILVVVIAAVRGRRSSRTAARKANTGSRKDRTKVE